MDNIKDYKMMIGIPYQDIDGIEMELTSKEQCVDEISELRKAINSIKTDLNKMKSTIDYDSISEFAKKYVLDAIKICDSQLHVKYITK